MKNKYNTVNFTEVYHEPWLNYTEGYTAAQDGLYLFVISGSPINVSGGIVLGQKLCDVNTNGGEHAHYYSYGFVILKAGEKLSLARASNLPWGDPLGISVAKIEFDILITSK